MNSRRLLVLAVLASSALSVVYVDAAEFAQQGPKLVGTAIRAGNPQQGSAAALSADGNSAVVGSAGDEPVGAVWVFTRSGEAWSQQGAKLVGTGAQAAAAQGFSVAVSRDGNTAIVGAPGDGQTFRGAIGATWVFQRSGGVWTQQGPKLVGTGSDGLPGQGYSVAVSGDGNTAIVGGPGDNDIAVTGAVWVFTRTAGVWSQQGQKLVGTGSVGQSVQGNSVALSDDGNTAVVGGGADNVDTGAAWIFTRSGGVWSQQGPKLVGDGGGNHTRQGTSVAVSADGNTAIVGGSGDNSNVGAVWVFTRTGGVWTQQGPKLVGTGAIGESWQGTSVSISADGNTMVVGGDVDSAHTGAAWIFVRNGALWRQQGSKLVGTGAVGTARQGASVAISGDARTALVGGIWDNAELGAAWVYSANLPLPIAVPALRSIVALALCATLLLSGLRMLRRRGGKRLA